MEKAKKKKKERTAMDGKSFKKPKNRKKIDVHGAAD
jgi:hypothetical protein